MRQAPAPCRLWGTTRSLVPTGAELAEALWALLGLECFWIVVKLFGSLHCGKCSRDGGTPELASRAPVMEGCPPQAHLPVVLWMQIHGGLSADLT